MLDALPTVYPQITDPTQNLAGGADVPYPGKSQPYYAYDGTSIGYSNSCDPITDEPYLSGLEAGAYGLMVPAVIEDNRITFWEALSIPLLAGTLAYTQGARPVEIAAWALGGFMAPYPVAAWLSYGMWRQSR